MEIKKTKKASTKKTLTKKTPLIKRAFKAIKKAAPKLPEVVAAPAVVAAVGITKAFPDKSMAQIYSKGLEFAFVGPTGEQCHPFAYCKDFLQDAVQATLYKKKAGIYGFEYDYHKNPALDMSNTRMGVRFKGRDTLADEVQNSKTFLNEVEAELGFSPSSVHAGGEHAGNKTYVFVSDKRWQHAPTLLSMYSLLLRVGLNYNGKGWVKHIESGEFIGSNDKSYIQSATPGIKKIVQKKIENIFADKIEDNYPENIDISSMHNYSGIVAYSGGHFAEGLKKNLKSK